jgi:hypothetical protein
VTKPRANMLMAAGWHGLEFWGMCSATRARQ